MEHAVALTRSIPQMYPSAATLSLPEFKACNAALGEVWCLTPLHEAVASEVRLCFVAVGVGTVQPFGCCNRTSLGSRHYLRKRLTPIPWDHSSVSRSADVPTLSHK